MQGGLQQWMHQFAERPRDNCPKFVSNRLTLLLDLGEAKQKTRLLQVRNGSSRSLWCCCCCSPIIVSP